MKKSLIISLIVILLISGLFILTGCDSGSSKKVTLKYEYDEKSSEATFKLSANDVVTEFDEEDPESARIENEKENYVLDLYIEGLYKETYEEEKEDAKEEEGFAETKFGKYDGYTYVDYEGDIEGHILLDSSDIYASKEITFNLYLYDETIEGSDINTIYQSENIQNILNNIDYK